MKITEETIPLIEKALDLRLFTWQKDYLTEGKPFPEICPCMIKEFKDVKRIRESCNAHFDGEYCPYRDRRTGFTTAHCIRLALSDGVDRKIYDRYGFLKKILHAEKPINIKTMEDYSDYGDGSMRYARGFYKNMFLDIWHSLKAAGFPVRELIH